MMRKRAVPTRRPKEYLLKYFDRDTCYLDLPVKHKKKHTPHFSNVLCKFYARDNCNRGEDCIFSHDATQFPDAEKSGCPEDPGETVPEEKKLFRSPFS